MKKINSILLIFAFIFSFGSPVFADTASYTTLTVAQEDQLNQLGSPSAIASGRHVNLGTLLKELIDPTFALSPSADSGTTNKELVLALTSPVDTTGTNSHYAEDITLTIGNATGGTNSVRGINIANVTGDAQVNVRGISIGTGTTLGTSIGSFVDSGWDTAEELNVSAAADSAQTNIGLDVDLTSPVDTTGTNTHYGINIDTTVGNATGGTNVVTALNIANVTGDAQVTEKAVVIGTGFDTGLEVNSPVSITNDLTGDGGDQFVGFLQNQVAATTTTLTAAQCGSTIVGDSVDTITLPEASTVLGCQYTFVAGTADDVAINPNDGTDVIGTVASITGTNTTTVLAPAAGDSITMTDIGASITLEAAGANLWISVGNANGIWTDTN